MKMSLRKYPIILALLTLSMALTLHGEPSTAVSGEKPPFWTELKPGATPTAAPADLANLVQRLTSAVVNIRTTQTAKQPEREGEEHPLLPPLDRQNRSFKAFPQRFFNDLQPHTAPRHSLGSGFLITSDGYIVTNNHVVENATDIRVALSDHEEYTARFIGHDSATDVALLKIDAPCELPVVPLGNSDQERIGEWVLAVGNPFGLGQTLTVGIISAKGRTIGVGPFDDFIQTDASINPGNSGGPLFNLKGEVIGINTAMVAVGQGLGFATPINLAKGVLMQLREHGRVSRGWVGLEVQRVTPELAESFGLDHERGALVTDVVLGSPAARAGVKHGDTIVEFNGQAIAEANELPRLVADTPPGSKAEMTLMRKGRETRVHLTLAELPEEHEEHPVTAPRPKPKEGVGLTVQELTPEVAHHLGVSPATRGLVVTRVQEGSPADDAGVEPGDIILEVNQQKTQSLRDYRAAIAHKHGSDNVLLRVRRGESAVYVAMKPEQ